jgi:DNA-binding transcriptional LysR family regulator
MLAQLAWIVPPPWASSRSKLAQMFYKHRLDPPADIIETASFLVTLAGLQQRPAVGFLARSVAQHFEQQGLLLILKIRVPIELPPVGIITLRGRQQTPAALLMMTCLRESGSL